MRGRLAVKHVVMGSEQDLVHVMPIVLVPAAVIRKHLNPAIKELVSYRFQPVINRTKIL